VRPANGVEWQASRAAKSPGLVQGGGRSIMHKRARRCASSVRMRVTIVARCWQNFARTDELIGDRRAFWLRECIDRGRWRRLAVGTAPNAPSVQRMSGTSDPFCMQAGQQCGFSDHWCDALAGVDRRGLAHCRSFVRRGSMQLRLFVESHCRTPMHAARRRCSSRADLFLARAR
jgi:hypothetical protein